MIWILVVAVLFGPQLVGIFSGSARAEYSSHLVLMPLVIGYLLYSKRQAIFANTSYAPLPSAALAAAALVALLLRHSHISLSYQAVPTLVVITALLFALAGFWFCYGNRSFRAAAFPFLMLFFIVPIPAPLMDSIIRSLQLGSAQLTAWMFTVLGVPNIREGFTMTLPGFEIEVARECSGINSTIALLITMCLVAHESLQRTSNRLIFLLLTIPLSIVKNAIRIVTLVLLSMYVDRGFLTGRLHHEGGFVFFIITLLLMIPIWKVLNHFEQKPLITDQSNSPVKRVEVSSATTAS